MMKSYIQPQDVPEQDAATVLDFLNKAESAEQIAGTIEIPGELDVGLGIARRILDGRADLGGKFNSLEQVAAIKYIGPERFTEIVMVLTGRQISPAEGEAAFNAKVLSELQTLKKMVAALQADTGPSYKVTLRTDRKNAFIGQPVTLKAKVKDRITGTPLPNVRLTLATSWGNLETQVGFAVRQGRTATVYTDLNGIASARFSSPTAEKLSAGQQAALETVLLNLDRDAHSPIDILDGLEQVVQDYHQVNNRDLRSAIDIYFSRRYEQIVNAVNYDTSMGTWEFENALVTAYVHDGLEENEQNSSVQCMAAVNLDLKDWLRPFYATFNNIQEQASGLKETLNAVADDSQESADVLDGILNNVYAHIGTQAGRVGEAVGQKVAQDAINRFMVTRLDSLPVESRVSIMPALSIAARSIRADTMGSLAVSSRIQKDVKNNVADQLGPIDDIRAIADDVAAVKGQLDEFSVNFDNFNQDYNTFEKDYAVFDTGYQDFISRNTAFTTNYNTFSQNYAKFDSNIKTFSSNIQKFNKDYSKFRNDFDGRTR